MGPPARERDKEKGYNQISKCVEIQNAIISASAKVNLARTGGDECKESSTCFFFFCFVFFYTEVLSNVAVFSLMFSIIVQKAHSSFVPSQ